MPTKNQIIGKKNFFNYAKRFDNLLVRYYQMSRRKKPRMDYSYDIKVRGTHQLNFKIKSQENRRYKVVTTKDSKVRVPRKLSLRRFDTPEEALREAAISIQELGFKVFKSNALDFIMGED